MTVNFPQRVTLAPLTVGPRGHLTVVMQSPPKRTMGRLSAVVDKLHAARTFTRTPPHDAVPHRANPCFLGTEHHVQVTADLRRIRAAVLRKQCYPGACGTHMACEAAATFWWQGPRLPAVSHDQLDAYAGHRCREPRPSSSLIDTLRSSACDTPS